MQADVAGVADSIRGMRGDADCIRRAFDGVSEVALSFHVAAALGRIETARLGSAAADLLHLGGEVRACAESIQERAHRAAGMAAALETVVDAGIARISDLFSAELTALPALTRTARQNLDELRDRRRQARLGSERLAERFGAFSEAVGSIVTALQFHDITRQQLEHVIDALAAAGRPNRRPSPRDAAVVELQRRHLLAAAASFAESVERVGTELHRISAAARQVAAGAGALAGAAKDEQETFFAQLERCFAAILAAVSQCGELETEVAVVTRRLAEAVAALRICAGQVREVARGIHYLSLNTIIQAVHLEAAGEPLAVVAGAMQTLQSEAGRPADQASDALDGMAAAVSRLSARENTSCGEFAAELRTLLAGLHASGEQAAASMQRIAAATADVCGAVERAAGAFRVGARFAEVCRQSDQALGRLLAECGAVPPAAVALDDLAVRYTMQSEREVHRELAAGSAAPGADALGGGDIELF
jgi:hypothetical protein